jgi:hypothetical protein
MQAVMCLLARRQARRTLQIRRHNVAVTAMTIPWPVMPALLLRQHPGNSFAGSCWFNNIRR